ncbi:MAG: hypothetical protein LBJ38_01315 [Oscillospiraceae bacterium]|jgi:hypothetical protein|nr:hypothetical protein [Oscillospiraceae bacterium]
MFEEIEAKFIKHLKQVEKLQDVLIITDTEKHPKAFAKPTILSSIASLSTQGNNMCCNMELTFSVFIPQDYKSIDRDEMAFVVIHGLLGFGAQDIALARRRYDDNTNCSVRVVSCRFRVDLDHNRCRILLLLNGQEIGEAKSCQIKAQQELLEVEPKDQPVHNGIKFVLELHRILITKAEVRVCRLVGFDVAISENGCKETFYGCNWAAFEKDNAGDGFSKMTVISRMKGRVRLGNDGQPSG